MVLYTLAGNLGLPCAVTGPDLIAPDTGAAVYDRMLEVAGLVDPACAAMDPIGVFEAMAGAGSRIACAPLIDGYVSDDRFAVEAGVSGRRLLAGALVFSLGLGLAATNRLSLFSCGYDRLRFIRPVFIGDTIDTIRENLAKEVRDATMGKLRVSYSVDKPGGELVLYAAHLLTALYRDPTAFAEAARAWMATRAAAQGQGPASLRPCLAAPILAAMFTIEHEFDATIVTLIDEGTPHLQEDVVIAVFEDCVTLEQPDLRDGQVLRVTLSMTQVRDLAAARDLPEGCYRLATAKGA